MRYFQIGTVKIAETESMREKSVEDIRNILLTNYPEIKNATVRQKTEGDNTVVEFVSKAGRKG